MIVQAYKLLSELGENADKIDKDTICRIHSSLMKTCQFNDGQYYILAGRTRTETVIVAGSYNIECCPFVNVDDELEYICKMNKMRRGFFFMLSGNCRLLSFISTHIYAVLLFSNGSSHGETLFRLQAGYISRAR